MTATDDPETIQKHNYVLQLYDEIAIYYILYIPNIVKDFCNEYFQQLKCKVEMNVKSSQKKVCKRR